MKFFVSFFIEQLHLVRLDMPRKDLQFCLIFVELFVFLIDSPMYLLFSQSGVETTQCKYPHRVDQNWFAKHLLVPDTQNSPVVMKTQLRLDSLL